MTWFKLFIYIVANWMIILFLWVWSRNSKKIKRVPTLDFTDQSTYKKEVKEALEKLDQVQSDLVENRTRIEELEKDVRHVHALSVKAIECKADLPKKDKTVRRAKKRK